MAENLNWRAFISTLCYHTNNLSSSLDVSSTSYPPNLQPLPPTYYFQPPPPLFPVNRQGGQCQCEWPGGGIFIPEVFWIRWRMWNPFYRKFQTYLWKQGMRVLLKKWSETPSNTTWWTKKNEKCPWVVFYPNFTPISPHCAYPFASPHPTMLRVS